MSELFGDHSAVPIHDRLPPTQRSLPTGDYGIVATLCHMHRSGLQPTASRVIELSIHILVTLFPSASLPFNLLLALVGFPPSTCLLSSGIYLT
ncbi:hypothetical protein DAEQUDRAFT_320749 [Daedalea quercina L-15889]|uniref:Uncharacterized protein n=1 Tax=Daedalea quercina L-15889 TaxID=1314783 RepID=A0A165PRX8_9APHY|nr:hypothetical protein DAEQUDRAFT_320749 [Daedalea quercina L-15889]